MNILVNMEEDVDDWMIAGINAMLDKIRVTRGVPFDLSTSIVEIRKALDPLCRLAPLLFGGAPAVLGVLGAAEKCEEGLKMTVTSIRDAWAEVQKIFPTRYEHDASRSERAVCSGNQTRRESVL